MRRDHPAANQGLRDIERKYLEATALHQRGGVILARALYTEILRVAPNHAATLHQMGIAALQSGDMQGGIGLITRSIESDSSQPQVHLNLGRALLNAGRPQEALACLDRALSLKADFTEAYDQRGSALAELNRSEEALASYERALQLRPDLAPTLNSRGTVLHELGRCAAALESYDRALQLRPDFAEAHYNRGNALRDLRRFPDAMRSYEQALQLRPDFTYALHNLGNALRDLQRPSEALACYERTLQLDPNFVDAHNNRGNALFDLGRFEEALTSYERALALRPGADALNNKGNALMKLHQPAAALACYEDALRAGGDRADLLNNRGNALHALGRTEEALSSYERALQLKSDFADAFENRGGALAELRRHAEAAESFARALEIAPDHDYAPGNLLHSQLHCCEWSQYSSVHSIEQQVRGGKRVILPGAFLSVSADPAAQLHCARAYVEHRCPPAPPLWQGERYSHGKIRVAYLSADFRDHATAYLMAELFERHDRDRFEITAISFGPSRDSEMEGRLRRAFDRFEEVRALSDLSVAQRVRELEIDIAVDLKGFTTDGRPGILAHRPAPIQVNYLGYPGTMGADYVDYLIADGTVIPPEHEPYYSEKIVRLPDCYQPNDSKRRIAENTPARAEMGLPDKGLVFCCFNNDYKLSPPFFELWMRLLHRLPGSCLWLLEGNDAVADNLRRAAAAHEISPQRLVFAPRVKLDAHLARHRLADLFLDTLPYGAHTTASDALWAGLPVLTCLGDSFAGRVAASLLRAIGLPELITADLREYEERAFQLSTTPQALADIRSKLARQRLTHPLFDATRFSQHLESALVEMWERHRRGMPPESFSVQPLGKSENESLTRPASST